MALVQRACNTALLVKSACCFLVENQLDAALPKIACAVVVGMLLIHHQQSNSTIEQITKAIISPTQILTAMGSCALLDRKMFVMGFILSLFFLFLLNYYFYKWSSNTLNTFFKKTHTPTHAFKCMMTVWTPGEDGLNLREGGAAAEPVPSVHFQDVSLWQTKFALILVKELDQGVHVHAVVEVHFLLRWIFYFGDGDGLAN